MDTSTAFLLATCFLGHENFDVRERMSHYLGQAGPAAYAHAVAASRSPDLETASRGYRLTYAVAHAWAEKAADEVRPSRAGFSNRHPWIDGLSPQVWPNRSEVISAYLELAQAKPDHRRWWNYRVATREFCRDLFAAGHSWREVVALLDVMADAEVEWVKNNPTAVLDMPEMAELVPEQAPQPQEQKP